MAVESGDADKVREDLSRMIRMLGGPTSNYTLLPFFQDVFDLDVKARAPQSKLDTLNVGLKAIQLAQLGKTESEINELIKLVSKMTWEKNTAEQQTLEQERDQLKQELEKIRSTLKSGTPSAELVDDKVSLLNLKKKLEETQSDLNGATEQIKTLQAEQSDLQSEALDMLLKQYENFSCSLFRLYLLGQIELDHDDPNKFPFTRDHLNELVDEKGIPKITLLEEQQKKGSEERIDSVRALVDQVDILITADYIQENAPSFLLNQKEIREKTRRLGIRNGFKCAVEQIKREYDAHKLKTKGEKPITPSTQAEGKGSTSDPSTQSTSSPKIEGLSTNQILFLLIQKTFESLTNDFKTEFINLTDIDYDDQNFYTDEVGKKNFNRLKQAYDEQISQSKGRSLSLFDPVNFQKPSENEKVAQFILISQDLFLTFIQFAKVYQKGKAPEVLAVTLWKFLYEHKHNVGNKASFCLGDHDELAVKDLETLFKGNETLHTILGFILCNGAMRVVLFLSFEPPAGSGPRPRFANMIPEIDFENTVLCHLEKCEDYVGHKISVPEGDEEYAPIDGVPPKTALYAPPGKDLNDQEKIYAWVTESLPRLGFFFPHERNQFFERRMCFVLRCGTISSEETSHPSFFFESTTKGSLNHAIGIFFQATKMLTTYHSKSIDYIAQSLPKKPTIIKGGNFAYTNGGSKNRWLKTQLKKAKITFDTSNAGTLDNGEEIQWHPFIVGKASESFLIYTWSDEYKKHASKLASLLGAEIKSLVGPLFLDFATTD